VAEFERFERSRAGKDPGWLREIRAAAISERDPQRIARWVVNAGPSAAARARACSPVRSTSGERPPMSSYFSAEDDARRLAMSHASGLRSGPRPAGSTSVKSS